MSGPHMHAMSPSLAPAPCSVQQLAHVGCLVPGRAAMPCARSDCLAQHSRHAAMFNTQIRPLAHHKGLKPARQLAFQAIPAVPALKATSGASDEAEGLQARRQSHATASALARAAGGKAFTYVAEPSQLVAMLEELRSTHILAVDCEGFKLGDKAEGKLTLIQLSTRPGSGKQLRVWLVDVLKLQGEALLCSTPDKAVSLKSLLEDPEITKILFDVRSDSAQLSQEFNVRLRGVYDLQLAEVAVRQLQRIPTTYVLTLDKVLASYLERTPALEKDLVLGHEVARAYHYTNRTEVWAQRPLTEELMQYAASDVRHMHQLLDALNLKLPASIIDKVRDASAGRTLAVVTASDRRAEAPVIVTRGDLARLLSGSGSPGQGSAARGSQGADSRPGRVRAGQESPGGGRGSRGGKGGGAAGRGAKAEQEPPAAPRALPPRLPLPGGVPPGVLSFLSTTQPELVLQPAPAFPSSVLAEPEPYVWRVAGVKQEPPPAEAQEPEEADGSSLQGNGEAGSGSGTPRTDRGVGRTQAADAGGWPEPAPAVKLNPALIRPVRRPIR